MKFGDYIKNIRLDRQITLREFCRKAEVDPSNWSKIERGIASPPKSEEVLLKIAKALNINKKDKEFVILKDYAAISHIPESLISNSEILEQLPVFFRTVRGETPNEKELKALLQLIKDSHESEI